MRSQDNAADSDLDDLVDAVHELMAATADVAGEKVMEARRKLAAALDRSRGVYGRVREKAVESARVANEAIH